MLRADGTVKVDGQLRTNVANIWGVGDVLGRRQQTPVALMEGMAFAHFCFGNNTDAAAKPLDYSNFPVAVRSVDSPGWSSQEAAWPAVIGFDFIVKPRALINCCSEVSKSA